MLAALFPLPLPACADFEPQIGVADSGPEVRVECGASEAAEEGASLAAVGTFVESGTPCSHSPGGSASTGGPSEDGESEAAQYK